MISGNNHNDAVSGARMTHLNGQAQTAVGQGVEYVTILMGANDVCTLSEATMTTVETFRSQLQQAMVTLTSGLPQARIFVASIPDIYHLWFILKDNSSARFVWSIFGICQSMLANPTSTAQADVDRRDRVRERNIDFNAELSQVCAAYTRCRFDNNGVFNTQFVPSDVSTLDYFHPSIAGQTRLAAGSWAVADPDGDGVLDGFDNCPGWHNPDQSLPPWPVPPDDPDCDGWSTDDETFIGTDPLVACGSDAWPPDFTNDAKVNIIDALMYGPVIFSEGSARRFDLNASGAVNIIDVLMLGPVIMQTCDAL